MSRRKNVTGPCLVHNEPSDDEGEEVARCVDLLDAEASALTRSNGHLPGHWSVSTQSNSDHSVSHTEEKEGFPAWDSFQQNGASSHSRVFGSDNQACPDDSGIRQTAAHSFTPLTLTQSSGTGKSPTPLQNHQTIFSPMGQNEHPMGSNKSASPYFVTSSEEPPSIEYPLGCDGSGSQKCSASIERQDFEKGQGSDVVSGSRDCSASFQKQGFEKASGSHGSGSPDCVDSWESIEVITERPRIPKYALPVNRQRSFGKWPQDHPIQSVVLAKAGYFFTGHDACTTCFCCGGSVDNWEPWHDVWVEHTRRYPGCVFLRLSVGETFILVVNDMSKKDGQVTIQDVLLEMRSRGLVGLIPSIVLDSESRLAEDVAVRAVLGCNPNGFTERDVVQVASKLKKTGQLLTSELICEELYRQKDKAKEVPPYRRAIDSADENPEGESERGPGNEVIDNLRNETYDLRLQAQCKVCQDNEVSVIFSPCSHFVSCYDCSFIMDTCPVCRQDIKGLTRAQLV